MEVPVANNYMDASANLEPTPMEAADAYSCPCNFKIQGLGFGAKG